MMHKFSLQVLGVVFLRLKQFILGSRGVHACLVGDHSLQEQAELRVLLTGLAGFLG
jgi:hypothetical protein